MVYCVVPLCESKDNHKRMTGETKISMHEFPSDPILREAWIKAIARKDPETNGYWNPPEGSHVCSLHFTPEQFKSNTKTRRLMPGSVPCIFPGYPQYLLRNTGTLKRFSSLISKNAITASNEGTEEHNIVKNISHKTDGINVVDENTDTCNLKKEIQISETLDSTLNSSGTNVKSIPVKASSSITSVLHSSTSPNVVIIKGSLPYTVNKSLVDALKNNSKTPVPEIILNAASSTQKFDISSVPNNSKSASEIKNSVSCAINNNHIHSVKQKHNRFSMKENRILTSLIKKNIKNRNIGKSASNQFRNRFEIHKIFKTKFESAQRRIRRYKAEILKLQEENEKIQSVNEIISEKIKQFNIEELEKGMESKDVKALFLNDQLRSLTKKRLLWSESTMEFANNFFEKFPASYSFLRQTDIISLPCPKILSFNDEEMDVIDSDS